MIKRSLTYLPHCLVPLLLLAAFNYWNGLKTVNETLSGQAQTHLNLLAGEIDRRLRDEEIELTRVATSPELHDVVSKGETSVSARVPVDSKPQMPSDVFLVLSMLKGRAHAFRITVFDLNRRAVFRAERESNAQGRDLLLINSPDARPPSNSSELFKREPVHILNGADLQYSVPLSGSSEKSYWGTLVAELHVGEVVEDSSRVLDTRQTPTSSQQMLVAVLDPSARIVYHTNRELVGKLTSSAQPEFLPIAEPLAQGVSGIKVFNNANRDFLTAFSPLPQWGLGIAVGYDRSTLRSNAHWRGLIGILLALVGGFAAALLITQQVRKKSHGLERVEEDLTAIAKGELDRRIILKSSDDARAIADNINAMTEQLRTQIAREQETRHFQSFVRLSAMLTHDLKNAIEALSLIVGNMETHFDNEEFRRDALKSLTGATDKLKSLVARLSRPLSSLSGEHPMPKSVDLVPIIKRVVAMTAKQVSEKHEVELNLPPNLFVFTDPERIERVIENLVINALEAMNAKKGKLTIEAGFTSRGAATFSVTDTGNGMSQSFIDNQLFRPFATTKKHGVGLGLYTCREVIEASAGSITVASAEGSGTTFSVVLPSASHDSRN
jgi:signal transduction histidine kinase